jgi:anti-sigma B factor antagonist
VHNSRHRRTFDAQEDKPVDIEVRTQSQVKVVKLRGRLGQGEALDRTSETLTDLLASGDLRLLLDLQEVPLIDSSGIGLLVRYLAAAKQRGGSLKLLNPSKFALQTLKLVRVLSLFEVFDDLQQAVASFS